MGLLDMVGIRGDLEHISWHLLFSSLFCFRCHLIIADNIDKSGKPKRPTKPIVSTGTKCSTRRNRSIRDIRKDSSAVLLSTSFTILSRSWVQVGLVYNTLKSSSFLNILFQPYNNRFYSTISILGCPAFMLKNTLVAVLEIEARRSQMSSPQHHPQPRGVYRLCRVIQGSILTNMHCQLANG